MLSLSIKPVLLACLTSLSLQAAEYPQAKQRTMNLQSFLGKNDYFGIKVGYTHGLLQDYNLNGFMAGIYRKSDASIYIQPEFNIGYQDFSSKDVFIYRRAYFTKIPIFLVGD